MDADDVERVVEAEPVLQADRQAHSDTGDEADHDAPTSSTARTGRRDRDQAGDGAGGGTERGGRAVTDALHEQPGEHRRRGGDRAC